MIEFAIILFVAAIVVAAWWIYQWCRGLVRGIAVEERKPKQTMHALLALCLYHTVIAVVVFGGQNYWLGWMITIPFSIAMLTWATVAAVTKTKRVVAFEYAAQPAQMPTPAAKTAPQPEQWTVRRHASAPPVEPYTPQAGGGKARGKRAMKVLRSEVYA